MNIYSKNNTFSHRDKPNAEHASGNIMNNRKKMLSRDIVCTNCGSKNHTYKQCTEPVTSWGIILITYGDFDKPRHLQSDQSIRIRINRFTGTCSY